MFYLTFPYGFCTIKYTEIKNFQLCLCLCYLPINFRKVSHQSVHLPPSPDSSRVTSYKGNEHNAESVLLVCISLPDQAHPVQHQFSLTSFKTDSPCEQRVNQEFTGQGIFPAPSKQRAKLLGTFQRSMHSHSSSDTAHFLYKLTASSSFKMLTQECAG